MAKKGKFNLLSFVAWVTGVIVSLAVGFSLALKDGALAQTFPAWLGGPTVAMIAGWIVIVTTILGVILAIIDAAS